MTRSQRHEIELAATPAQVWAAITEPEEMKKWYIESAEIEPREGGSYWIEWGPGMNVSARIEVWDPPRRLRIVGDPSAKTLEAVEEFTVEPQGDRTLLRLDFTGIPDDESWDGFYDGTNVGWQTCFALLRNVLEQHPEEPVAKEGIMGTSPLSPTALWHRTVDDGGLLGFIPHGEEPCTFRSPLGETWSGTPVFVREPSGRHGNWVISLAIDELGGGLFHLGAEDHGGTFVYGGLIFFGESDEVLAKAYRDLVGERFELKPLG